MLNKEFIQRLIQKLKVGNRASILLNALPSNYVTRLDLNQLSFLSQNEDAKTVLAENINSKDNLATFINQLLNNATFSIDIDYWDLKRDELSEDLNNQLKYISKRLDSMYYQAVENNLEYVIKILGLDFHCL